MGCEPRESESMSTGANAILLDTSVVVRHFRGMGGVTGKLNEVDRQINSARGSDPHWAQNGGRG